MLIQILILVFLIFLNAMFASSELALLSLNKVKINKKAKEGDKKSIKIKKLMDNPSNFLATIQIGITLAGFLASAFAAETFSDDIIKYLGFLKISSDILKPIIVIIVTIVLSYFTLVFGELLPKRIAMLNPEKVSRLVVDVITVLMKITYPFVWILTRSTNILMKIFGVKDLKEEKMTEEEIKYIISSGKDTGVIEPNEKDLIFNIFNFNDTELKQIMTKKDDVIAVDINISNKDLISVIKTCKYTRLPVYIDNINNILGILNVKDIIINYNKNEKFDLKQVLRGPCFFYETDKVDDVFREMQRNRQSLGIVMKSDEEVAGIVTVEDAVEEIVGNIFDEYDGI